MQVFCDIPGINLPLGLVVLEWTDKDESVDWANITYISRRECLRINALMSQAKKEFLEK
jgi:hypothetical protein